MSISFSYRELIATGLSGALHAFLASKWKLPGVLIGALSHGIGRDMAIVKAYSSGAAVDGPKLPGLQYILAASWWVASRPAGVRQAILLAGLRAGLVSTVISASTIVGIEIIADKNLSRLAWTECHPATSPEPPSSASPSASP